MTRAIVLWSLSLVAGCSTQVNSWERALGIIDPAAAGPLAPVAVPARVQAGVPFTVALRTLGSSTCTRPDGAGVRVAGSIAELTPYVREAPAGTECTDDLALQSREVRLRFEEEGSAIIRVIARSVRPDGRVPFETSIEVQR